MEKVLSIIAIVISVISGGFALYTFIWTARRDRKQATLDAFNILQNEAFDKLNQLTPAEIREIATHPRSKEYKDVSSYIARIEHFCVGVNTNIYDKTTVFQLANGYLNGPVILERIEPIIEKKKHGSEKDYYENIHKVVAWMNSKNEQKE